MTRSAGCLQSLQVEIDGPVESCERHFLDEVLRELQGFKVIGLVSIRRLPMDHVTMGFWRRQTHSPPKRWCWCSENPSCAEGECIEKLRSAIKGMCDTVSAYSIGFASPLSHTA